MLLEVQDNRRLLSHLLLQRIDTFLFRAVVAHVQRLAVRCAEDGERVASDAHATALAAGEYRHDVALAGDEGCGGGKSVMRPISGIEESCRICL